MSLGQCDSVDTNHEKILRGTHSILERRTSMDDFRAIISEMDYDELVNLRKWAKQQCGSTSYEGSQHCKTLVEAIDSNPIYIKYQRIQENENSWA